MRASQQESAGRISWAVSAAAFAFIMFMTIACADPTESPQVSFPASATTQTAAVTPTTATGSSALATTVEPAIAQECDSDGRCWEQVAITSSTSGGDAVPIVLGDRLLSCVSNSGLAGWQCQLVESLDAEPRWRSNPDFYCSGSIQAPMCSAYWYPHEMQGLTVGEYKNTLYVCNSVGNECFLLDPGSEPQLRGDPDLWCDSLGCTEYDPDEWVSITFDLNEYFCQDTFLNDYDQWDCYLGEIDGPPEFVFGDPDLYCSGSLRISDCSDLWYPDELIRENIVQYGGQAYLCEPAFTGRIGDYECAEYSGGDPRFIYGGSLRCSTLTSGFACDDSDFPSLLDSVFFTYIGGTEYVCESVIGGSDCYAYYFGSIEDAMFGLPDLYCNRLGECDSWLRP